MKRVAKLKAKSILLIEDETVIRENIAATLRFFFKEVYTAIDGLDGIDKYEAYLPDIVMTDLKMPNMDGLELIETLLERGSNAYMIIVSAHTDTELLLKALHQGVDRYIVKPIDEKKLFESFEAYLDKDEASSLKEIRLRDGLIVNLDKSQIQHDNESFTLSRKELLLLKLLLTNQQKAFTYEEIEYHVWGSKSMSLSALRTVVRDLRKKLGSSYVNNVSGVGYSFI
jgi:DNA-binding response OmpR family regulator